MSKSRAFIAAPLIGTIIFLTAIVFVVNINKAESNAVTAIGQEAYHNRITSIVELYRSDSGSLFREDMKRLIEDFLASQCWSNFNINVENNPGDGPEEKQAALRQARFQFCSNIRTVIQSTVCSNTGDSATFDQIQACNGDIACLRSVPTTQTFGLQKWLTNVNQQYNFEGILLSPVNAAQFQKLFNPQTSDGNFDWDEYFGNCHALMKDVSMDCEAFARSQPVLQCCKVPTSLDGACRPEDVLPGCGSGIFYIQISPRDPKIYSLLPRVEASFGNGNVLRAPAFADSPDFYLPINYPLLKYADTAFNLYSRMAYGQNIAASDGAGEGLLDGACYAGAACNNPNQFPGPAGDHPTYRFAPAGDLPSRSIDDAEKAAGQEFYNNVFTPAIQDPTIFSPGMSIGFNCRGPTTGETGVQCTKKCKVVGGALQCDSPERDIINLFAADRAIGINSGGALLDYYGYYDRPTFLPFAIYDENPTFRVLPNSPNGFCTQFNFRYS